MTSLNRYPAQISRATGYYINVAAMPPVDLGAVPNRGSIYQEPTISANGSMTAFSTAGWAVSGGAASAGKALSTLTAAGALLKDMGVTLVSSGRTFRKIQLVVSTTSTFGVGGAIPSGTDDGYLTGYIELGLSQDSAGFCAPVASFGR